MRTTGNGDTKKMLTMDKVSQWDSVDGVTGPGYYVINDVEELYKIGNKFVWQRLYIYARATLPLPLGFGSAYLF